MLVQNPSHHACALKANWLSATMLSQKSSKEVSVSSKTIHSPQHCKDGLPTSFQKGVSWDHIQRNSYHYYTLHGNLRLTYVEFQIYNPFDRQIIVPCTLQAWRWTRILKTHTVVLDPLLRNDVACSPWVYQPAGLRISYPYTTYKTLRVCCSGGVSPVSQYSMSLWPPLAHQHLIQSSLQRIWLP